MKIDSLFWMVLLPIVDLIGNYFFFFGEYFALDLLGEKDATGLDSANNLSVDLY